MNKKNNNFFKIQFTKKDLFFILILIVLTAWAIFLQKYLDKKICIAIPTSNNTGVIYKRLPNNKELVIYYEKNPYLLYNSYSIYYSLIDQKNNKKINGYLSSNSNIFTINIGETFKKKEINGAK